MRARVFVTLKPSVFDPQGKTIADALHSLGYAGIEDVRQGKYFELDLATSEATQARALAAEPRVVILDESVAALDVSIQAQVLNLLADIHDETGVSFLCISHDLAVVRQLTQETLVMWRGKVVERGPTAQVLDDPHDDYTKRLRASVPHPGWKPPRHLHTA